MNDRILELAEEAGFKNGTFDGYWVDDGGVERFAELIVRECANIANKQFSTASGLDDRDCWTANEMKQHFGVE